MLLRDVSMLTAAGGFSDLQSSARCAALCHRGLFRSLFLLFGMMSEIWHYFLCNLLLLDRLVKCPMQEKCATPPHFDPFIEAFRNLYRTWVSAKYGLTMMGQVHIDRDTSALRYLYAAGLHHWLIPTSWLRGRTDQTSHSARGRRQSFSSLIADE